MKNFIYLFLAVTIFSCSSDSDDSSDTNDISTITKKIVSIQVVEDIDNICLDGVNSTFFYSGDDITSSTNQGWSSPCTNFGNYSWLYTDYYEKNYIYSSNSILFGTSRYNFDINELLTSVEYNNEAVCDDVLFEDGKLLELCGANFIWTNNNLTQFSSGGNIINYTYSNIDNKTDFITPFFFESGHFIYDTMIPLIKKGLFGELSSKLPSSCIYSNSVFGQITSNFDYILDDEGYPIYMTVTSRPNTVSEKKEILELTYTN